MANKRQVLDKISRNLDQLGIANVRGDLDVTVLGITISYVDAEGDKPELGVDDAQSPFLGIGVGNPGQIKLDLGGADLDTAAKIQVLQVVSGHANDLEIANAATAAVNGRIRGHADLIGMGA